MSTRRPRLAALAAPALALVIGAGLGAPAGATASDPIDEVRERVLSGVSASSTTGGAGSTTADRSPNVRLGHIADPIGDVEASRGDRRGLKPPARYARTIDINRFGYHVGQRTAKFTIRTRDLRRVASGHTMFWIDVTTRSRAVPEGEQFNVSVQGRHVQVTGRDAQGECEGGSVTHDGARNTVTVRVPVACLTGDDTPTSMQVGVMSILIKNDWIAWDYTASSRRIDLRS